MTGVELDEVSADLLEEYLERYRVEYDDRGRPSIELPGVGRKRVVSVKLDPSIVEEIDRVWRELGYSSRSQFIREAIIYYMLIVKALRRDRDLCICRCSETPEAKRLEDWLYEQIAEYVGGEE